MTENQDSSRIVEDSGHPHTDDNHQVKNNISTQCINSASNTVEDDPVITADGISLPANNTTGLVENSEFGKDDRDHIGSSTADDRATAVQTTFVDTSKYLDSSRKGNCDTNKTDLSCADSSHHKPIRESDTKHDSNNLSSEGTLDCEQACESNKSCVGASTETTCSAPEPTPCVYHVKWIHFKGSQVAIITQNENGPCPLLAIINCLLLKAKVQLPSMMQMITSEQLMHYLADCVFENAPKNLGEESLLNYEQNTSDAMAVFDKLQTGLDVNVRFTGIREFEYTRECIVFDLLGIQLYHGWLADPQSRDELASVGQCTYNQLVEKIIEDKNSESAEKLTQALCAEQFLQMSSHQLTYHGLSELSCHVSEAELSVFFRNNHFSTLLKHKNELFTLVTDQGFLAEPNVVWETLNNVEGDCHFVDSDFRTYRKPESLDLTASPLSDVQSNSEHQINHDYMVALSLQQDNSVSDGNRAVHTTASTQPGTALTDHELALRLQDEEDRHASRLLQQQSPRQSQTRETHSTSRDARPAPTSDTRPAPRDTRSTQRGTSAKKSDNCTLL